MLMPSLSTVAKKGTSLDAYQQMNDQRKYGTQSQNSVIHIVEQNYVLIGKMIDLNIAILNVIDQVQK